MALPSSISLVYESINQTRTTVTIDDDTVYTSPARSGVGVFVGADKMNYESEVVEALVVTGNDNDPETDTSWTITKTDTSEALDDGWVRIRYVGIVDYAGGTTYALYDAAFDPSTNLAYRSKQDGNVGQSLSDNAWWELITDPSTLADNEGEENESENIASTIYSIQVTGLSELAFGTAIANASIEGGDSQREQTVKIYNLLGVMVDAQYVASDRSQNPQGERLARRTEVYADEFDLV